MTETNETETPQPDPMLILELTMGLPAEWAEFGIMEKIALPADVVSQVVDLEQWIDAALQTQFQQVAWSLKTTLLGVLRARAGVDHPLTGQEFHDIQLARQQAQAADMEAQLQAAVDAGTHPPALFEEEPPYVD